MYIYSYFSWFCDGDGVFFGFIEDVFYCLFYFFFVDEVGDSDGGNVEVGWVGFCYYVVCGVGGVLDGVGIYVGECV